MSAPGVICRAKEQLVLLDYCVQKKLLVEKYLGSGQHRNSSQDLIASFSTKILYFHKQLLQSRVIDLQCLVDTSAARLCNGSLYHTECEKRMVKSITFSLKLANSWKPGIKGRLSYVGYARLRQVKLLQDFQGLESKLCSLTNRLQDLRFERLQIFIDTSRKGTFEASPF